MTQVTSEGDLRTADLLGLLVRLWDERFTGALRFEDDGLIKIIYFKEGDLLSASTNDRTDSIGEIFLKADKLTREHLKQAMSKRKETESLAEVLLGLGFISRTELTWARRNQLVGVLRSVMGWPGGNYAVVSDYLPKREEGSTFPFSQILLQVVLTEQDRARTETALEHGSLVMERSEDFQSVYSGLDLDDEADQITRLIDGERSVAEIASASDADSGNVYKLLYGLMLLRMIRPLGKANVIPEETPISDSFSLAAPESPLTAETEPEPLAFVNGRSDVEHGERSSRIPLFLFLLLLTIVCVGGFFAWRNTEEGDGEGDSRPAVATNSSPQPSPLLVEEGFSTSTIATGSSPASTSSIAPLTATGALPTPIAAPSASVSPPPQASPAQAVPTATIAAAPRPSSTPGLPAAVRPSPTAKPTPETDRAYTIQFAILCEQSSVSRLTSQYGSQVWFSPITLKGRACQKANWGRFADRTSAQAGMDTLPPTLRQGAAAIVPFTKE